ncbi:MULTISPECIES: hypothetical protein [unclassified Iodidimonas]|jgi:hypothetical protein|uniref:hypothetical protein n=1 Tax=unclassified Iodidimonas TaxID=2626145 RepID=UPI0024821240|nr:MULTISPECIES: hypothetical protein [unclassified Iodidimonas]
MQKNEKDQIGGTDHSPVAQTVAQRDVDRQDASLSDHQQRNRRALKIMLVVSIVTALGFVGLLAAILYKMMGDGESPSAAHWSSSQAGEVARPWDGGDPGWL